MHHAFATSLCAGALALLAVAMAASHGWAQDSANTDAQNAAMVRKNCRADYAAHCSGGDPPAAIEKACLAQYYVNLSRGCQAALDAARAADADQGGQ